MTRPELLLLPEEPSGKRATLRSGLKRVQAMPIGLHRRKIGLNIGGNLLAACCVFSGASGFLPVAHAQTLRPLPSFDLESVDGTRFTAKALGGKVALIDLWATLCAPCIA